MIFSRIRPGSYIAADMSHLTPVIYTIFREHTANEHGQHWTVSQGSQVIGWYFTLADAKAALA